VGKVFPQDSVEGYSEAYKLGELLSDGVWAAH
jgi:hypothetical protein